MTQAQVDQLTAEEYSEFIIDGEIDDEEQLEFESIIDEIVEVLYATN